MWEIAIKSTVDTHGGNEWDNKLEGNDLSFGEVHAKNSEVDPAAAEEAHEVQKAAVKVILGKEWLIS